ncbi:MULTISPECIES: DUF3052 family protein [unclassified Streptomyces]|uniref:DUF3052 family protein n=1 Tax=unclassified Streptomyces TaxID=2593676 RepID=UPI00382CA24F
MTDAVYSEIESLFSPGQKVLNCNPYDESNFIGGHLLREAVESATGQPTIQMELSSLNGNEKADAALLWCSDTGDFAGDLHRVSTSFVRGGSDTILLITPAEGEEGYLTERDIYSGAGLKHVYLKKQYMPANVDWIVSELH